MTRRKQHWADNLGGEIKRIKPSHWRYVHLEYGDTFIHRVAKIVNGKLRVRWEADLPCHHPDREHVDGIRAGSLQAVVQELEQACDR